MDIEKLQQTINYKFKNTDILLNALAHSSYANESNARGADIKSNERLEFLGDSVLSLIVSTYLYEKCPEYPEGELSKIRAQTVCEKALAGFAKEISLGDYILLGHGERANHGEERASILSDAFEAVLAAIFLDGGMDNAKKFVRRFLDAAHLSLKDYKTLLQEIIQKNPGERLSYVVTGESGPDHDKVFNVEVHLNSNVIGKGTGKSKKQAEQAAAKEALALMGFKD